MLGVLVLGVIMLGVIMLGVIMLSESGQICSIFVTKTINRKTSTAIY
jgi:hypothetical protein